MIHDWLFWFGTDWHWAIVIACLVLFFGFGVIGFAVDDSGDWWIF